MVFTIGVTGHRNLPTDTRWKIIHGLKCIVFHLLKDKMQEGVSVNTVSGMALGADLLFVIAMVDARRYYKEHHVPFSITAAIPFKGQCDRWNNACRHLWSELLDQCDDKIVLSNGYYTGCYKKRNQYIVDHSDVLIAVWNGNYHSGTGQTVRMAKSQGRPVIVLDPRTLQYYVLQ